MHKATSFRKMPGAYKALCSALEIVKRVDLTKYFCDETKFFIFPPCATCIWFNLANKIRTIICK